MSDTKKEILAFIKKHKGEMVIDCCNNIVRLIGFHEDEMDYYYTCQAFNDFKQDNYGGIIHNSAVGWIFPLKGRLPKKEYDLIENHFTRNWLMNYDKEGYEKFSKAERKRLGYMD